MKKIESPKAAVMHGAEILSPVLVPHGFRFQFRQEGKSSGGRFAWGEFVRDDRRLEFHVRYNLGLVRYHAGNISASHEAYMRELQVLPQCRYPGFTDDRSSSFRDLAHDVALAGDFLFGSAAILRQAAAKEALEDVERDRRLLAGYSGDLRKLEELHSRFKQGRYRDVLALAKDLRYPDRMKDSERRMVEIARKRMIG